MKVQTPGSDKQNQLLSNTDSATLSQLSAPTDFFSDIITSMLSVSAAQMNKESESRPAGEALLENKENHAQEVPAPVEGVSGLLSDILTSLAAASFAAGRDAQAHSGEMQVRTPLQNQGTALQADPAYKPGISGGASFAQKTVMTSASLREKVPAAEPGFASRQSAADPSLSKPMAASSDKVSASDLAYVVPESAASDDVKPAASRINVVRDLQRIAGEESLRQPMADFPRVESDNLDLGLLRPHGLEAVVSRAPATMSRQDDGTGDVTVYHFDKGPSLYTLDTGNRYADALVQMGSVMQNQISQTLSEDRSFLQSLPASRETHDPDHELKIDWFPASADMPGEESYIANIKIHPPELGSVMAKLKIDKNGAQLILLAENQRVKEIVELNLPHLREGFQKMDIQISHIQVDVQSSSSGTNDQNTEQRKTPDLFISDQDQAGIDKQPEISSSSVKHVNSLIDTYA
ncbi:hypothetical protein AQUSIP_24160 [Aquicella siphonis]|uniref:Flagellar hook-length control protein-like C-terminal domain-containing protein n=1 Tax=Aquicella siphonis TaxID=254247 RepID=A0A5E4PJ40_9COXI|nr:flagellar hook-length control protein FliK [Aquicella siphonis]VVC77089.1 hypothetical protein AQUSIP_24160 [Aquicella siphonis]